ncbi:MAG: hypothetical protein IPG87_09770 [Saprospiraceae bacterium]|nr:hypothetical protein [Candidatus Vicinibacter affinis]
MEKLILNFLQYIQPRVIIEIGAELEKAFTYSIRHLKWLNLNNPDHRFVNQIDTNNKIFCYANILSRRITVMVLFFQKKVQISQSMSC